LETARNDQAGKKIVTSICRKASRRPGPVEGWAKQWERRRGSGQAILSGTARPLALRLVLGKSAVRCRWAFPV